MKKISVLLIFMSVVFCIFIKADAGEQTAYTPEKAQILMEPSVVYECDYKNGVRSFAVNDMGGVIVCVREPAKDTMDDLFGDAHFIIYIFDCDMSFKYGIKFKSFGTKIGTVWKDGMPAVVIADTEPVIVQFDESGNIVSTSIIRTPLENEHLFDREKQKNGKTYVMTNRKSGNYIRGFYMYTEGYKYLVCKSSDEVKIIYAKSGSELTVRQKWLIAIIVLMTAGAVTVFINLYKRHKKNKEYKQMKERLAFLEDTLYQKNNTK